MKIIQVILLLSILTIGVYYVLRVRKRIIDMLFAGTLVGVGVVFTINPELSNKISQIVGVGRGSDLVFYLSILLFWFVILRMTYRIRKLEQTITELIRNDALRNMQASSEKD